MPTTEQLATALKNADAAGDVDAARKLAAALRSAQAAGQPTAGKPSDLESIGRGALEGVSFGFDDEIGSGVQTGFGLWGDYGKALEESRGLKRRAQETNPIAYGIGAVGGALPTAFIPGMAPARAATLGGRLAQGARLGAVYGGLYGAGTAEGDLKDRAAGALRGGAVGAVTGAAAEPVAAGIGALANRVAAPVRAALNPVKEAGRRVTDALRADKRIPQPLLSGADDAVASKYGQPVLNIDRGGEKTRALARSAANTSPEGRGIMQSAIDQRYEGQGSRVVDAVRRMVGGKDATTNREILNRSAKAANRPAYNRAYAAGDRPIISPELERLTGSPDVVKAMQAASQNGKTRAIAEGSGAFNARVNITPDGRVVFNRGKGGVPDYPNLQFWDYTYRELRDAASAAARQGRKGEADALGTVARQMRDELDRIVPEFGVARAGAARFFGAESALEAGEKFVTSRVANDEAVKAVAKMGAAERRLFAEGFADGLVRRVQEAGDRRNVVINGMFNSPAARQRINIALGSRRAKEMEAILRVEGIMDMARQAMGNSTTARQLVELGLAGGSGVYGMATGDWRASALVLSGIMLRHGKGRIDANVAKEVARMLVSPNPEVMQKGVEAVARSEALMDALRKGMAAPVLGVTQNVTQAMK